MDGMLVWRADVWNCSTAVRVADAGGDKVFGCIVRYSPVAGHTITAITAVLTANMTPLKATRV